MNEERVSLGQREQKRALVAPRVLAGPATAGEGATALGRSAEVNRRDLTTLLAEREGLRVRRATVTGWSPNWRWPR